MKSLDTRYGALCVPEAADDLIGRFLSAYGEWAHDEVRFVANALPRGPVRVLDVGSFVGTFGIGLTAEAEVSALAFVEANPVVARALRKNVESLVRVPASVIEAAVVPGGQELTGRYDESNLGSLSFAGTTDETRVELVSKTSFVRLSDIFREHGGFDLIKMDVEGLEYSILESDRSLLLPGGPAFWLECNEEPVVLDLAELLISAGLTVHYFAFPAFAPNNFHGEQAQIFPWAYESGLWASRGDTPSLSPLLAEHNCILKTISSREDLRIALWQTPRWGRVEWKDASPTALVAEAAHAALRQEFDDFLAKPARPPGLTFHELRQEAASLKNELQSTQTMLDDSDRRRADAENKMRSLEAVLAVAKQFESVVERQRLELSRLSAIEQSTYWRAGSRIRRFLSTHPKIKSALRSLLTRIHRILKPAK
ncbi:FkbM family methyltransferase [Variovorax sp. 38R]|uniref:FkbM family methyltransferase n=1 Tax=Variovorax sp. 38R TaxID=2774875 RepID=UPI00177DF239|nr:FkbM family methyltransferase [Variovorax sp. 38R]QOF79241.1 FkbM family methyltransferase [Variovorax sp. 38R]